VLVDLIPICPAFLQGADRERVPQVVTASPPKAWSWVEPKAADQTEKHRIDYRIARRPTPEGNEDVVITSSHSTAMPKVSLEPRDCASVKRNQTILSELCLADYQAVGRDVAEPQAEHF
jgi:hypothetical protein